MVTLSAAIMAHPVREHLVADLLAQLDRPVPVAWDRHGPPSSETWRRWETGRAAWELVDPNADWAMVLQDDITVSHDFLAGMEQALAHVPPDAIVQPYVGTKKPDPQMVEAMTVWADRSGASWISLRSIKWGPAICVPTWTVPGMLAWCSDPARQHMAYDKRIGHYYRDRLGPGPHHPQTVWRAWYPWPSLVDHRPGPSICGHSPTVAGPDGRTARRFHQGSALEVDWSGPAVSDLHGIPTPGRLVGMSHDPFRPKARRVIASHNPTIPPEPATENPAGPVERPTARHPVADWRRYLTSLGLDSTGTKQTLMDRAAAHNQPVG